MTSKQWKAKWDKARTEAAKYKLKFEEIKRQYKNGDYSDRRAIKKELDEYREKLRNAEAEASYYRKQYVLTAKAEGKNISSVSLALGQFIKRVKESSK